MLCCFHYLFQCVTEEMTRLYMEKESYNVTQCQNAANTPCSSPHLKDVLDINVVKGLKTCPTLRDYNCEKTVFLHAMPMALLKCSKPCQKWRYQMTIREDRFSDRYLKKARNMFDTVIQFYFSTDTFMNIEEAQVEKITQNYNFYFILK